MDVDGELLTSKNGENAIVDRVGWWLVNEWFDFWFLMTFAEIRGYHVVKSGNNVRHRFSLKRQWGKSPAR